MQYFFETGIQYYVAGRYAAFAGFTPVAGNLLHHALEMFMKGYLSSSLTLEELKKQGHHLGALWRLVKNTNTSGGLDKLDRIVLELDKFERIRYPDSILDAGMMSMITFEDDPVEPTSTQGRPEPVYQVAVRWVDELVEHIFDLSRVNPGFFTERLNECAKEYLEKGLKAPHSFRCGRRILCATEAEPNGVK